MPWVLRILRGFLGVTFVFAGAQKFLDPNFLHPGSDSFIKTQLLMFARGTPVAPLMRALARMPVLTGVGIALAEIAIGLATLFGVAILLAALGGAAINTVLWLSATWHIHPYFLGSDSIYAIAWIALFAGLLQAEMVRGPLSATFVTERARAVGRRELLRGGMVAALAIAVGVVSKAFAGAPVEGLGLGAGSGTQAAGVSGTSGSGSGGSTGKTITTLDRLPVGKAIGFTDPALGPAVLFRMANGNVVAYSRSCTHAGCEVGFDPNQRLLYCPCHGAEFDPEHGAVVLAGPAPTPLQPIRVTVEGNKVILPAA